MARTITQEFTKGLWAEIPPFRLVLGLCPTLAITNTGSGFLAVDVWPAVPVSAPATRWHALRIRRNVLPSLSRERMAAWWPTAEKRKARA